MPVRRSVETLHAKSLQSIAQNFIIWSKYYSDNLKANNSGKFSYIDGPFNFLDSECLSYILGKLWTTRKLRKEHLELLIVPALKEINFKNFSTVVDDDIIDLVCMRCKGLAQVELDRCNRISSQALLKLVKKFHSTILHLSLSGLKISKELLEFIGSHCDKLRVLCISMCWVSKSGFGKLIFEDETRGIVSPAGKTLAVLTMDGCDFKGEMTALSRVLKYCPSLRRLTHFDVWPSIIELCHTEKEVKLELVGDNNGMPLILDDLSGPQVNIPKLFNSLPYLTELCLDRVLGHENEFTKVLIHCGANLLSLKNDWSYQYDLILYIGAVCPKLESLEIHVMSRVPQQVSHQMEITFKNHLFAINGSYTQPTETFSSLKHLTVTFPSDSDQRAHDNFGMTLHDIMKHAKDSMLCLKLARIPDRNINSTLVNALRVGYMQHLKSFCVCGMLHIHFASIWELLLDAPKLSSLTISHCRWLLSHSKDVAIEYVKTYNLNVKIDWAPPVGYAWGEFVQMPEP